jgi:hypothetical protein
MRFFASGFFHGSVSPQPQSIPLGPFQILFENLRRYSQVTVHHRINDTVGKFATDINGTGCKFCHYFLQILPLFSLVLLIPVANLPPVSMTPAANLPPVSTTWIAKYGNNIRLQTP